MNLLSQLPFFDVEPQLMLSPFELHELFRDGCTKSKLATDGILRFHSVTFATSNAKEMARYFEAVLGFEEIAFRNLETSSSLVAAHVVRNGNVFLAFANNLETPDGVRCSSSLHRDILLQLDNVPNSVELACLAGQFASVRKKFTGNEKSKKLVEDAIAAWNLHRFINRHGMGVCDISLRSRTSMKCSLEQCTTAPFPLKCQQLSKTRTGQ